MQKTTAGVLIALIIIAAIAGAVYYKSKGTNTEDVLTPREEAQQAAEQPTKTINVKHQYKEGVHTFMGSVEVPTPCYDIAAVVLPGDLPELRITTTEQQTVAACAQVISEKTFKVSHQGPEDMQFLATVNGELVNLNQFDIDPDVDIESVEILIKG